MNRDMSGRQLAIAISENDPKVGEYFLQMRADGTLHQEWCERQAVNLYNELKRTKRKNQELNSRAIKAEKQLRIIRNQLRKL